MGAKDSKPCCMTYEEAVKRVSEAELKRLKEAFKRVSTLNGSITKHAFVKDVIGEGVPSTVAEYIYTACGGTQKGITLKDLLCGLVLLTRGKEEEKVKFLFCLYSNENGSFVVKDEMLRLVHACEGGFVPESVLQLFSEHEKVPFEEFREWLQANPDATSLTRWLLSEPCAVTLSNDTETPTFYQTLAGVTHLEENDIIELEKQYWHLKGQSRTGKLDLETLVPLVCPPIPISVCQGVFHAFDENRDGHIDFKEMACGISAACRGPLTERQKFCFKVFDGDRDGVLNESELRHMANVLLFVRRENRSAKELAEDQYGSLDTDAVIAEIRRNSQSSSQDGLTQEEYLMWTVGNSLPLDFLNLLFQVCHIVLGLRPVSRKEEAEIVRGWLEREERRGFQVGQFWYLISIHWWRAWNDYVNYSNSPGVHGSESQTSLASTYGGSPSGSNSGSLKRGVGMNSSSKLRNGGPFEVADSGFGDSLPPGDIPTSDFSPSSSTSSAGSRFYLQRTASPKKASSSSLTLLAQDCSRPPSGTSSPTHSPRPVRKIVATHSLSSSSSAVALGGLGSSYGAPAYPPPRPGPIDNSVLVVNPTYKVITLTGEGGKLKRNTVLVRSRDFELVPDSLWKALHQWYDGSPALPRQVILRKNSDQVDLELYPLNVRLLRHQVQHASQNQQQQQQQTILQSQGRATQTAWSGMVGGYGAAALSTTGYAYVSSLPTPPKRYLAYVAAFSCMSTIKQVYDFLCSRLKIRPEDMRLWLFRDENNMMLIEEEEATLEELNVQDEDQLLIEVRNKDLTWPEEMGSLATNLQDKRKQAPAEKGATGLNNLGNTCFMNAALQCVSNTRALTQYFTENMHLYELNRTNPLGMKGHIAKRYGDLIRDIWSGTAKTIAPLKLRWTIGKYAPRFNGFQQHDSQELLAFLLDGLHEDLNRVHDKPYLELKDSGGRPDVVVAQEAWENHILRNKSIIVDLFHGQLKSKVTCKVCSHESVRFDPFNYLSLPLPMESYIHVEVIVVRLDGSMPIMYGLRLNMDEKYSAIKEHLSPLCGIPAHRQRLAEVAGAQIKSSPPDDQKIKTFVGGSLYAYELPQCAGSQASNPLPLHALNSLQLQQPLSLGQIEEDRAQSREAQTFTQIQRTVQPRNLQLNGSPGINPGIQPQSIGSNAGSDVMESLCNVKQENGGQTLNSQLNAEHEERLKQSQLGATAVNAGQGIIRVQEIDQSLLSDGVTPEVRWHHSFCMPAILCFKSSPAMAIDSPESSSGVGSATCSSASSTTSSASSSTAAATSHFPQQRSGSNSSSISGSTTALGSSLGSSPSDGSVIGGIGNALPGGGLPCVEGGQGFIIALHRKMIRQEVYFLSSQKTKPSLFGLPLIVPCGEMTTHQDLYQAVWLQVARLVSPLPPSEASGAPNHAQDCDDSLGYEFPFVLKTVQQNGMLCALCPWYRFCRGCRIQCSDAILDFGTNYLAIDWDPTALHLRYQTSLEKEYMEHPSVSRTRQQQSEPIDLDFCLEAFTKEEHLGEDEKYYCSQCRTHQLASKTLQIWRLPPILIVHLKRFQFVNGKWIKSQKVVNFPFSNFDPTAYLASVPRQTVIRYQELKGLKELKQKLHKAKHEASARNDVENSESPTSSRVTSPAEDQECVSNAERSRSSFSRLSGKVNGLSFDDIRDMTSRFRERRNDTVELIGETNEDDFLGCNEADVEEEGVDVLERLPNGDLGRCLGLAGGTRGRIGSTSLATHPVGDGALQDFHQHSLLPDVEPFELKYNLYAVVCHSGKLGGGHYVSYACNPNGKWYCYNDSSCKEVTESQIDTSSAYMLFYERKGLCQQRYMPNIEGKVPDVRDLDEEFDSDLKKLCSVM
ncbi:ubiquitin carboxyl-terminal hydrolase 32 isoform X1 [Ischnura elegans]|uniref:ubiquitin carboxyl-terminal hydrolase 32 isoform X1 n=1 Tax=Ischnura elegans TaxID=197161 RepID=UPI001ED8797D|nr:ubiquitin carboxyl-terminal hydrolase 32 isoform X1 [Ischnura elegans]